MNKNMIKAIQNIYIRLDWMILDLKNYYGDNIAEDSSLKVRPGYGYDKFYLNWIEGSYDMSLQSLVNFMLQDCGHYKKILSKETYRKISIFNKNNPEGLYDFGNKEDDQQIIDIIEWSLICGVRNSLEKHGFHYEQFIDAGYDMKSLLPHVSKYALIDDIIISASSFREDLKIYLTRNELSKNDTEKLINIVKVSGDHVEIATLCFPEYPVLTKEILKLAILECRKKSECSKLAYEIKKLSNDKELIDEANTLKEIL